MSQYLKDWWPTVPPLLTGSLFWAGLAFIALGFWQVRTELIKLLVAPWHWVRVHRFRVPWERIDVGRADGATLVGTAIVRNQPQVGTHPDDIADKLKATKEVLEFIRGQARAAQDAAMELRSVWKGLATDEDAKNYALRLGRVSELITACYAASEQLRHRYREYDDIPAVLRSEPIRDPLTNLTGELGNAALKTRDPGILESFARNWLSWISRWRQWREEAEERLIEIKRQLTR